MIPPLRVAVAGAGVFGLASALALARAGARVTLHDPGCPTGNASAVAAGMLAPVSEALTDPAAGGHLDLLQAALALWPAFAERHGLDLDRSGALLLGDEARLAALSASAQALGLAAPRRLVGALPRLTGGYGAAIAGGLEIAGDWRIDAAALWRLGAMAEELGVTCRTDAPHPADHDLLVVATGPSMDFLQAAPELAVLTPIRGHILRYPDLTYDGPVLRGPGAYGVPSAGGLLIGATMEPGEGQAVVDPEIAARLAARAQEIFPGLAHQSWTAAVGVRAATPDGLPLVGPSARPGVILACGARRNGWLMAPLVGEVVAAFALGRDPGPRAAHLAPSREAG